MADQSLRAALAAFERGGELRRIAEPVTEAPCQQVVVDEPDLASLPLPWFFEHETGPYVTAGAIVARDCETGAANLSIARVKPLGGARAMVGIAPNHHLAVLGRRAAEKDADRADHRFAAPPADRTQPVRSR